MAGMSNLDHGLVDGGTNSGRSAVGWSNGRRDGSGFRLMPTKPYSVTHFLISATQLAVSTPGLCGSIAAPAKMVREQPGYAVAQLVADGRPFGGDAEIADMVGHEGGARAEDSQVDPTLAHFA